MRAVIQTFDNGDEWVCAVLPTSCYLTAHGLLWLLEHYPRIHAEAY